MSKRTIAIIYGGQSTEHEISIRSARNIAAAVDKEKFDTRLIGVAKNGIWYLKNSTELAEENVVNPNTNSLLLRPGANTNNFILQSSSESIGVIDAVFPIIHGTGGEDGTLQGLLKTLNIPFVGPGVIGSALCIDKDVTKRILNEAGIKNSKFLSYTKAQRDQITYEKALNTLGLPMYVKPPNLGSSVGISKVTSKSEFYTAIDLALKFDRKVLIEENIVGREIECAVLGNQEPKASPVGEVVTLGDEHKFYSYDAKYIDADGSKTMIPAELDESIQEQIQTIAIKAFKALNCEGMARVDVFVKGDGEIIVNEVNTIPGFTNISMYPKLWEAAGIAYSDLITKLVDFAIARNDEENKMQRSV